MSGTSAQGVSCDSCGRHYKWLDKLAGKKVRCKCGQVMRMPEMDPADDGDLLLSQPSIVTGAAPAAATASTGYCPSCKEAVKPGAVICMGCGFNIKEGKQLKTQVGGVVRASTGPADGPRRAYSTGQDGFFTRFSRGWEMAKISYGIIWDFKKLIIFPVLSAIAAILVSVSYALPVFMIDPFSAAGDDKTMQNAINIIVGLGFYFCNYSVIVFFNTALTACTMKITAGEAPSIRYGLSIAVKRLPQILAWALVSAIVGQLIKILESYKMVGKIMAVILGSAWAILTYFVVPVICVEGVGPVKAVKGSFNVIKESWGEGLVGNSALGFISFLIVLPAGLVAMAGVFLLANGSTASGMMLLAIGVVAFLVLCAASSAADGVFKALLYNYATGREMPADIDMDVFGAAFAVKSVD